LDNYRDRKQKDGEVNRQRQRERKSEKRAKEIKRYTKTEQQTD